MQLTDNPEIYASGVQSFNRSLITQLDELLPEHGISDTTAKASLIEDLLFTIGAHLDGAALLSTSEEQEIQMLVAFQKDDKVHYSDNSLSFHEGAMHYIDEYFFSDEDNE